MRNWKDFVAERLAGSRLPSDLRDEVVTEIADHLEDFHDDLAHARPSDADDETRAQVADWNALGRRIRRSKEDRMDYVKKLVVPGVAAAILGVASLRLIIYLLVSPRPCGIDATCITVTGGGSAHLAWLAALLAIASLGAGIARRLGARPPQRLLVALSPALYMAAETFVLTVSDGFLWRFWLYFVVIPAIVCVIGAVPFLGLRRDRIDPPPVAAHASRRHRRAKQPEIKNLAQLTTAT